MKTIIAVLMGIAAAAVASPAFAAYDASSSKAVARLPASPVSRSKEARAVPELIHGATHHGTVKKLHALAGARRMPNGLTEELGGPV